MPKISSVSFTKNHPLQLQDTLCVGTILVFVNFHSFQLLTCVRVCVCACALHSLHRHATESVEDFSLHFEMPNADDDSVSGVCCSTAVPARGGDILTRSGVRLGIICTYIIYLFTYMLYVRTHILHIRYIRIYIK